VPGCLPPEYRYHREAKREPKNIIIISGLHLPSGKDILPVKDPYCDF